MPIHIRPATVEDAAALTAVQIASWRTTYRGLVPAAFLENLHNLISIDKWAERLASPALLTFVAEELVSPAKDSAEEQPGIVGFVHGGALREPAEQFDGELYAIYLLLPAQGRGTGRALATVLAGALRTHGFKSMLVWVLARNNAVGFYEKLGARRVAEKPIEIGGAPLLEVAFGWDTLEPFANLETVF